MEGAAAAANAAPEICLRNLRLEFIVLPAALKKSPSKSSRPKGLAVHLS
jgi:hypothetical protein